jgi:hypothetical protein
VGSHDATLNDCAEAVELARADLAATIDKLRMNLKPANLIDEMARGSGLRDVTVANGFYWALRRRPLTILLLAGGVGFWVYYRSRTSASRVDRSGSLRSAIASLGDSAAKTVRERAKARGEAALGKAQNFVEAGATQLCDAVEKEVGDLVQGIPASAGSRLLIDSAVRLATLAVLEVLLPPRSG